MIPWKPRTKYMHTDAQIGIFWYTTDKQIMSVICQVRDGHKVGSNIRLDAEPRHVDYWDMVMERYGYTFETLRVGYKSIERGEVMYAPNSGISMVICSKELESDEEFRSKIAEHFTLNLDRTVFLGTNCYKCTNTGAP